jgi:carboxyl-terminal processing protease
MAQSWMAIAFATLVMGLAGACGAPTDAAAAPKPLPVSKATQRLGQATDAIISLHVTPVDEDALARGAVDGMMRSLDAQSEYLSPEDVELMNSLDARVDVGLFTSTQDGVAKVTVVVDGGAASRAGVSLGDYIVAVDGKSVLGLSDGRLGQKLSGPPGQPVTVSVIRDMRQRLDLTLVRDRVAPEVVTARMEGDYAYLRITRLNQGVSTKASTALVDLITQHLGFKGLVLDLRDNPGGLLEQAVAVSDLFLDKGQVFTQRGRSPADVTTYTARSGDTIGGLPMVVLINGGTAAGGEIIASALQDNHRARIVGAPSFGRGSIQTVVPLQNGTNGALKVTSAYFYRPSGPAIDGVGVTPDVAVTQLDAQLARALALLKAGG